MKLFDPEDTKVRQQPCETSNAFTGPARVSLVLAAATLAVGVVCIMVEQWAPGLILVLAAVAGVMTAWQMRGRMPPQSADR